MSMAQYTGDRFVDGCRERVEREIRKFPFQSDPIRQEFWAMYEHSKTLNSEIAQLKKKISRFPKLKSLNVYCVQCGKSFTSDDRGDGHPQSTYCSTCHIENSQH